MQYMLKRGGVSFTLGTVDSMMQVWLVEIGIPAHLDSKSWPATDHSHQGVIAQGRMFQAYMHCNCKYHLGSCNTSEEAAHTYDEGLIFLVTHRK